MARRLTLPTLAFLSALPGLAAAQQPETPGDPARGAELARARCAGSGCHQVGPGEQQAGAGAISFQALASRNDYNNMQILEALEEAKHPPIQGPKLERQQLRDIVAYIRAMTTGDKR